LESSQFEKATIFSDCRSILDALSSCQKNKSNGNYLVPLCRSKFHALTKSGYSIDLAWIPSYIGIPGNERADQLAKQAAIHGRKPKFKIPYTDYCAFSARDLREKSHSLLKENFLSKGTLHHSLYFKDVYPSKTWFHNLFIPRGQIVLISRIRSNYYNLNSSLQRKNIVRLPVNVKTHTRILTILYSTAH